MYLSDWGYYEVLKNYPKGNGEAPLSRSRTNSYGLILNSECLG